VFPSSQASVGSAIQSPHSAVVPVDVVLDDVEPPNDGPPPDPPSDPDDEDAPPCEAFPPVACPKSGSGVQLAHHASSSTHEVSSIFEA
jgi:hypothetical protein